MSESNPNEESVDQTNSGLEEEGDITPKKSQSTGARLWDRVRGSLLKPKVKDVESSLWIDLTSDVCVKDVMQGQTCPLFHSSETCFELYCLDLNHFKI